MKFLKYALLGMVGLIVLCVVVLLALGGWRGTTHLESDVVIARPPSHVYAWISEPDRVKQWVSWLADVRTVTPELSGVGRKEVWLMDDPTMGERLEISGEVVAADVPRLRQSKMTMAGGFDGVLTYKLTDLGGSTRLEFISDYEYASWVARLMSPIVTYQAQQKMTSDVATLKRLAETD
jgi:carbon monoxide dehydrogenase subunit G